MQFLNELSLIVLRCLHVSLQLLYIALDGCNVCSFTSKPTQFGSCISGIKDEQLLSINHLRHLFQEHAHNSEIRQTQKREIFLLQYTEIRQTITYQVFDSDAAHVVAVADRSAMFACFSATVEHRS